MSKKKKNLEKEEIIKQEDVNEEVIEEVKGETSLDEIEPELEETESYKKASFREKVSLKFRKKLLANRFHTLILVVLLVAIIVGINIWADSKNLAQIDVTKNKLYSLTDTSKDQLKSLDKEVMIYVYGFTESDDLIQFLQQYNAFNKNIKNEIINESTNYDLVSKYGLGTYSALIVTCGEKDKIIYPELEFSDYSSDGDEVSLAEESITNAIIKVSTDDPVKVYFATGNGEYGRDNVSSLTSYLEYQVYEAEDLNLLTITEIPSDCDILAILAPESDISEEQAEMIKTYANNGGNLLVCALTPEDGEFTNLQKVLDLYGVKINKGLLYEGDSNRYLASRNAPNLNYVLIPGYSSSNPITSKFSDSRSEQTIIMPWSQGLTINDVTEENVTVDSSEIVTTSSSCYNIENYQNGVTSKDIEGLETSTYTIGSELTRKVTNGENTIESKLVVYGNTTFFTDVYRNSLIQINVMENAGNANLILNTFAELAEEDNLLTIRKATNVLSFQNTESEDRIVKVIIFGIPVLIILVGIIVWNYRRKKR